MVVSRDTSADDLDILARTVVGEARSEPEDGQIAVVRTIINRFNSGRWYAGKTLAATAQKPFQYSCWNKADPNRAYILRLKDTSAEYRQAFTAVQVALQSTDWPEITHYYNPLVVACPAWAYGRVAVAMIGKHLFFANVP